jgi:translation initiation factor eIF-2B subunit epsilon
MGKGKQAKEGGKKPGGGGEKKGGGGGGRSRPKAEPNEDMNKDQKLQAVILADTFNKKFHPMSWECPKVLLPLANVPMLEYAIEMLAKNGVEEVYVFSSWHTQVVQKYINESKWAHAMVMKCLSFGACSTTGEALREIDKLGVIRSDPFILIHGDVVSNMDLTKAIAYHKEKRKADSNTALTIVMKPVSPTAGIVPISDDLTVCMDAQSKQVLFYEHSREDPEVELPIEIVEEHPQLQFRTDLMDCHIDICSPEFLLQFSDNFDYQDVRRDFIKNEAVNWELGMHIYSYELGKSEYAARVHDLRTYHAVSGDVLRRWALPFVPEARLASNHDARYCAGAEGTLQYAQGPHYVYKEPGVRVARNATVGSAVMLGANACVGERASVDNAIVGRNCSVGADAKITNSHLWEGCVVEDGAEVDGAIICNGAVVKSHAKVPRGCVVSFGAVIGSGVALPEFTRVSLCNDIDDDDAEDAVQQSALQNLSLLCPNAPSDAPDDADMAALMKSLVAVRISDATKARESDVDGVGADGVGYVWTNVKTLEDDYDEDDSDDEDSEYGAHAGDESPSKARTKINTLRAQSIGASEEVMQKLAYWATIPEPVDEADDDDEDFERAEHEDAAAKAKIFYSNVIDLVVSAHKDGHPAENVLMEIKAYKFAQNKTFSDLVKAVVPALVKVATGAVQPFSQNKFVAFLADFFKGGNWGNTLLKALLQDVYNELCVIESLEVEAIDGEDAVTLKPSFRFVLQVKQYTPYMDG